jgi:hypothetical protein
LLVFRLPLLTPRSPRGKGAAARAAAPCNDHKRRTILTNNTSIPLNKLLVWEGNVRKTDPDKGIDELAASIPMWASWVVRRGRFLRR